MSQTYCGKSCEGCEYLTRGECGGCASVASGCEIALCCNTKKRENCSVCDIRDICVRIKKQDQVPALLAEARKVQEIWMESAAEYADRAPILGKWMWILCALALFNVASSLSGASTMLESIPVMQGLAVFLEPIYFLIYGAVLLKFAAEGKKYRIAGLCNMLTAVLGVVGATVSAVVVIASLAATVVSLFGKIQEYEAHAAVVTKLNPGLSKKWKKLRIYAAVGMGCLILNILLMSYTAGMYVGTVASIVLVILNIFEVMNLYRTARLIWDLQLYQRK